MEPLNSIMLLMITSPEAVIYNDVNSDYITRNHYFLIMLLTITTQKEVFLK